MFFNLFKKNKNVDQPKEENNVKEEHNSIKFTINKDGEIYADVNLADYEKETISNFAILISNLSSFRFHMEIIDIVKNGFLEHNREDLFEYLLSEIINFTQSDVEELEKIFPDKEEGDGSEDSPCIKPSDML